MAVLIAGHQRSGTTLLKDLCNSHPQVQVTGEFGNFMLLDEPYPAYARFIWNRWWRKRNAAILEWRSLKGVNMVNNLQFVLRYLAAIRAQRPIQVDARVIEQALQQLFPGTVQVGDKYPDHIFRLNKLARDERLRCVFIFRDPRDVVNSTLKRARAELRESWPDEMRDPREIAERWLQSIDMMERNQGKICALRYEDLVTDPRKVLAGLGNWLGVDGYRFDHTMVRTTSIGKHRQGLSSREVEDVVTIAGPIMRRLGYSV